MTHKTSVRSVYLLVVLVIAVMLSSSLLFFDSSSEPVLAQSTATPSVFLPVVIRSPLPKTWSGIHLGNRNSDWDVDFLRRIDPALDGAWPAAVVVLSHQIYQVNRYPNDHARYPCRIKDVSVRSPRAFDYIRRAAQADVRVIIRIYPSPGNFEDWYDPVGQPDHHLSTGPPVGPDGYCRPDLYRSKADIANEMGAIHRYNTEVVGFSEFGFEPANEPNVEWYKFDNTTVALYTRTAWREMDAYFSAVYDWVHDHYPNVKVFTPPMGQAALAERVNVNFPGCDPMELANGPKGKSGYDYMPKTYGPKNDGVNWHNYWIYGKEKYNTCQKGGQHVSYYFPKWLRDAIRDGQKPVTITEADLASPISPQDAMGNPLKDKNLRPVAAADSIRHFFDSEQEFGVSHYGVHAVTVSWLLTDNTDSPEHNWHKAYLEDGAERPWFKAWYLGKEPWP